MIDLDQLLDITLYGKRIESIGVEQEVYVPVLYCEDKENQWYDKDDSIKWLQRRTEENRSGKNDMHETIEDFDNMDKLGQGFSSADPLEEIDIGDGSIPRPTFIKANMKADQKSKGKLNRLFLYFG